MLISKARLLPLLLLIVFLTSCATRGTFDCDKDRPAPQRRTAMNWNLDPPRGQEYELLGPRENLGLITFGNNLSVENNQDGAGNSQAVVTFNCGTEKSCVIQYSMGGSGPWGEGEEFQIEFTDANGDTHRKTHPKRDSEFLQRHTMVLPTCGQIRIKVTMDEGTEPGIQARATIGPFVYYCSKCEK